MKSKTLLSCLLLAACSPSLTPPSPTDDADAPIDTPSVILPTPVDAAPGIIVDVSFLGDASSPIGEDASSDTQEAMDVLAVDVLAVDVLAVDVLAVDVLAVDVLAVDVLAVDVLAVDVVLDVPVFGDIPDVRSTTLCPPRTILVDGDEPFCVDEASVTTSSYRACFMSSPGCSHPRLQHIFCVSLLASNLPINCIDWQQAANYCAWSGHGHPQLPSEAQWERYHNRFPTETGFEWTRDLFDTDAGTRRVIRDFAHIYARIPEEEIATTFRLTLRFRCVRNPT